MSDDDGTRRRFDPRFDPAFQPGYDPRNDPAAPARSAPVRSDPSGFAPTGSSPARRPAMPRPDEPISTPPAPSYPRAQHLAPDQGGPAAPVPSPASDIAPVAAPDAEPPVRGMNPFSLAVWVISVLLLVGGIAIYRALPAITEESSSSAGAANNFIQLFTLGVLASVIVGVGLIGIVGNLLLLARRFEQRR